jgi:hypothetical protein
MGINSKNWTNIKKIAFEEDGQGMVEYALIFSVVFLIALPAVVLAGKAMTSIFINKIAPTLFYVI